MMADDATQGAQCQAGAADEQTDNATQNNAFDGAAPRGASDIFEGHLLIGVFLHDDG